MNEEEIVLQDDALGEDNISSDQDNTLNEKLDRIEALLNEDIALREASQEQSETVSGNEAPETVSGNSAPDYGQYIYDLLTDSSIKVEIVQPEEDLTTKSLNDYTVGEALQLVLIVCLLGYFLVNVIEKYVFKIRR